MRTSYFINPLAALLVTVLLVLVSCEEEKEKVVPATITLSEEVISLVAGTQQTLTATVSPAGTAIEWISNRTDVATVEGGVVKAVAEGRAKIVAKTDNSASICEVIVTNVPIPVTKISLNKTEVDMRAGDVERLTAVIQPEAATNRRITWSSSSDNIVTVQSNGTLIAHTTGSAMITAKTVDGNHTATCTVSVLGKIELLAPSNNSSISLDPVDPEKKVNFTWRKIDGIGKYILKISKTEQFGESDIVYTAETAETSLDVVEYGLNEAVKELEGKSVPLFWAIFSGTPEIKVLPEARKVNFVPNRREYLRLATGSATGMQVQKMAGEYHYSITANGQATINTVGLSKDIPLDSGTFVVQYKNNKALSELTVRFKKPDGTVSGSISQGATASTGWKELRIVQTELPAEWGDAGDYLQLDFGNVSNYQMELNAINLQTGVYVPEILFVESFNDNVEMISHEENYFKFKVLKRDPVLMITPFTRDLPAKAVLVSFEYKSDKIADHCQIFLLPLKADLGYPNTWGPAIPMNNTSAWKEHTVDITNTRAGNSWWGKAGPSIRIDPGQDPTIGMTMEIRNIQIKMKD